MLQQIKDKMADKAFQTNLKNVAIRVAGTLVLAVVITAAVQIATKGFAANEIIEEVVNTDIAE